METIKTNSKELIAAVAKRTGLTVKQTTAFTQALQELFNSGIENDKIVKISGLGSFKLVWILPRKSVNVNTGADMEIAGHYRLSFSPDTSLQERINAPLAHLKTVELTDDESAPVTHEQNSPLQKLSEQAQELQALLSDIRQLNQQPIAETISAATEEPSIAVAPINNYAPEPETEEPQQETNTVEIEQPVVEQEAVAAEQERVMEETVSTEAIVEQVIEPTPTIINAVETPISPTNTPPEWLENPRQTKQGKWGWITLGIVVAVLLLAGGLFYFNYGEAFIESFKENVINHKVEEILVDPAATDEPAAEISPIINDSTTANEAISAEPKPVEADVFSRPRHYETFLATETVAANGSLVNLSQKYYGDKLYWVYIYEANRAVIQHPDNLKPGQNIKIPKLPPALIDSSNPKCKEYALQLKEKYLAK